MTLMCSMPVDFALFNQRYGIDMAAYFATEIQALAPYVQAGLVHVDNEHIQVTAKGRLFVRAISMEFDRYLRQATSATYSRLI